jgi:membrane-bound serine protease (ClpP class)
MRLGLSTRWRGWQWALAACLLAAAAAPALGATAVVLQVRGAIGPASADYMIRGIRKAEQSGAALVVIELDTPGGLDRSMRDVIQTIVASRVPVAVYVSPEGARAASAGTFLLYAAHIAAMAPATTLGAATPVAIGLPGRPPENKRPGASEPGQSTPQDAMTAKQVHDAAAFIRGLAQLRGRNAQWAERAVREAVSLTAQEALREQVVDIVARDRAELLARLDGRTVRVQDAPLRLATRDAQLQLLLPDWRHRLLSVITDPGVALILLMLGVYGLVFEFASPGAWLPGTLGAICLILALFALELLPVNYAGLGLVLLGLALIAAEAFMPSLGLLGLGGLASFVIGAVILFDTEQPGYGVPLPLVLGLALASALLAIGGASMALRARRRPVVSGPEQMLGAEGVVLTREAGTTWAQVHGERWKVRGPAGLVAGDRVRVTAVQGLELQVERLP